MERVIKSVEVIMQHVDDPDHYCVGGSIGYDGQVIDDIVEQNGIFYFYDSNETLLLEIRHCPVIVAYREEEEK
ncbi:hypothetical protein P4641_08685 [Halalkalibacterium halodurans]|uniref:hypothetical protein n=1 Tax=Halalkalibacterium halodurans TaxID=86665 RepID=UPI002E1CFE7B|nr:hypothetical protein [Halalkalibacterium halodurans]